MHISLVPRHKVGENIFLPKHCVPFCEFFLVTVWYANVHVLIIMDKIGMRVSCFPALSGLQTLPSGQQQLQDACHVVSCTSHRVSATFSTPFPPSFPSPSALISVPWRPTAPRPSWGILFFPSLCCQRCCCCSPLSRTRGSHPFNWHTAVLPQFVVEKLLFFFLSLLRNKFESEPLFFLFCSFFFM